LAACSQKGEGILKANDQKRKEESCSSRGAQKTEGFFSEVRREAIKDKRGVRRLGGSDLVFSRRHTCLYWRRY